MSLKQKVIAIDGPSASGKGTVASRVAEALGFLLPRLRCALPPDRALRTKTKCCLDR